MVQGTLKNTSRAPVQGRAGMRVVSRAVGAVQVRRVEGEIGALGQGLATVVVQVK